MPLATEVAGFFRPALFALFGAAAFLLVITCTNGELLLARHRARARGGGARRDRRQPRAPRPPVPDRERAAGGDWHIARDAVAVASVKAPVATTPVELPRLGGAGVDGRMLLFATTLALITAIAFGVVPAMPDARRHAAAAEGIGARRRRQRARRRAQHLVVAEIGLAVMLPSARPPGAQSAPSSSRILASGRHAVTARVERLLVFRLEEDCGLRRSIVDRAAPGAGRVDRRRQQLPAARSGVARGRSSSRTGRGRGRRRAAGTAPTVDDDYFARWACCSSRPLLRSAHTARRRRDHQQRRSRAGNGPARIRPASLSCRFASSARWGDR